MLSARRQGIAIQYGMAVAHSHFVMMLNPRFRGPQFRWQNLADQASKMAETGVALQGDFKRDLPEMRAIAARVCHQVVNSLLQESAVEEWLPTPAADGV